MPDAVTVTRNEASHRFEIATEAGVALLNYKLAPGVMTVLHTEVPAALEGRGLASSLARAALDHARANGLRVVPTCPFVRKYMERHPEYQALRAPS